MGMLDALIYGVRYVFSGGAAVAAQRENINFTGGLQAVDNPSTQTTDVSISSSAGVNAFAVVSTNFTQPSVSSTVSVTVSSTAWMGAGQAVYVVGGGYYQIASITDGTHVVLTNLGYTGNASPTSTVGWGAQVSPAGLRGLQGSNGAAGAAGTNAYSSLSTVFTQPAVGSTVTVVVSLSSFAVVGQVIYIQSAGYYLVTAVPNISQLTVQNLGYTGNVSPSSSAGTIGGGIGPAGLIGPTGAAGAAGAAGGVGSGISWVDLASAYSTSVSHSGTANTIGNAFWTSSPTATTAGGRIYWKYSGSGTDTVVVSLWLESTGTLITSQTLSITATGVYSFSWAAGTESLSPYVLYTVSYYCPNGFTSLNAGAATETYNLFYVTPTGSPPWQGTVMAGKSQNYWQAGQSASGNAFPSGSGSPSAYATVEATVTP